MAVNAGVPHTVRILSHHAPKVAAKFTLDDTSLLSALLEAELRSGEGSS
jgi:hypothetical protein